MNGEWGTRGWRQPLFLGCKNNNCNVAIHLHSPALTTQLAWWTLWGHKLLSKGKSVKIWFLGFVLYDFGGVFLGARWSSEADSCYVGQGGHLIFLPQSCPGLQIHTTRLSHDFKIYRVLAWKWKLLVVPMFCLHRPAWEHLLWKVAEGTLLQCRPLLGIWPFFYPLPDLYVICIWTPIVYSVIVTENGCFERNEEK